MRCSSLSRTGGLAILRDARTDGGDGGLFEEDMDTGLRPAGVTDDEVGPAGIEPATEGL